MYIHYITRIATEKELDRYCLARIASSTPSICLSILTCIESNLKEQDRGRSITIIKQNKTNSNCGPE